MTRLADLQPLPMATLARVWLRRQTERFCAALGTQTSPLPVVTPLEQRVEALVDYAQKGAWSREESPRDALHAVYAALYTSATHPGHATTIRAWLANESDSLAVMGRAVLARAALEQGDSVPRQWLATLADTSEKNVRNAVARRELADVEGERPPSGGHVERPITAESARAWLAARGVAGVEKESG